MSEPELLQDLNKQPLPRVSSRSQIAQLVVIAAILSLTWLASQHLNS